MQGASTPFWTKEFVLSGYSLALFVVVFSLAFAGAARGTTFVKKRVRAIVKNMSDVRAAKAVSRALDVKATADGVMKQLPTSLSKREQHLKHAKSLYEQAGTELLRLAKETGNSSLL